MAKNLYDNPNRLYENKKLFFKVNSPTEKRTEIHTTITLPSPATQKKKVIKEERLQHRAEKKQTPKRNRGFQRLANKPKETP